jgi:hypothetical protein
MIHMFSFCQVDGHPKRGCVARSKQAAELARVPAVEATIIGANRPLVRLCVWDRGRDASPPERHGHLERHGRLLLLHLVVPPASVSLNSSSPECATPAKTVPIESTPLEAMSAAAVVEDLNCKPVNLLDLCGTYFFARVSTVLPLIRALFCQ